MLNIYKLYMTYYEIKSYSIFYMLYSDTVTTVFEKYTRNTLTIKRCVTTARPTFLFLLTQMADQLSCHEPPNQKLLKNNDM